MRYKTGTPPRRFFENRGKRTKEHRAKTQRYKKLKKRRGFAVIFNAAEKQLPFFGFLSRRESVFSQATKNGKRAFHRTFIDFFVGSDFRTQLPDFKMVARELFVSGILHVRPHGGILRAFLGAFAFFAERKTFAQGNRHFLSVFRRRRNRQSATFRARAKHDLADGRVRHHRRAPYSRSFAFRADFAGTRHAA